MRRGLALLLAALGLLAMAGPAVAAERGSGDKTRAEQALQRAGDLKRGVGVRTGRELTVALAELVKRRGALDTAGRREAAALLARPTDDPDPQGDAYTVAEATPYCLTNFCVHYVTTTADAPALTDTTPANGVPDYVERMAEVFENDVFPCQNGIAPLGCAEGASTGLGWPAAPNDGTRGGGPKFDVYLKQLGTQGIFGYVAPDPDQPSDSSLSSYLVMDDDYAQAEFGYPDPMLPLKVTAAHEYNHVLQFGIEAFQDTWMFESTATWVEDEVYPSIDDYVFYLDHWVELTDQPLTAAPNDSLSTPDAREDLKIYGSAVWNHWLSGRFGDDVILDAWDASTDGGGGPIASGSYNTAIAGNGGVGFSREFEHFSVATAEWRAPNAGFPDNADYPDIPATARPAIALGAAATSITLDHTTFAFRNVTPPASPLTLRLNATLPAGLKGAVALVGRTGSATTGTVEKQVQHVTNGGSVSVLLPNANSYSRITAVFVNSDDSQSGWHNGRQDWNWSKDNQSFSNITLRTATPPTVTTAAATSVGTTSATLNGTVNPNGSATTYKFEYGTTTAYGSQIPLPPASAGSGTSAVPVSATPTGLTRGTTYHFRLVATNADGTVLGADQRFTTKDPPDVTTDPATAITGSGATLNATLDPKGKPTTYRFEYGTTTAYGSEVAGGPTSSSGPVSLPVTLLAQGTTYHFRVVATNADGTSTGSDRTFTTKDPPEVTTEAASGVTSSGATLNATVDPNGKASTYKFEYGTTTAYGSEVSGGPTTTSGSIGLSVSGLTASTTYHFRVVATNSDGTTTGSDRTFTTAAPAAGGDDGSAAVGTAPGDTAAASMPPPAGPGTAIVAAPAFALTLTAARSARLAALLRTGVRTRATSTVACRVSARLVLTRAVARRLGVPRVIGRASRSLAAATPTRVQVRVTRRFRRKLARARTLVLTLQVTATDAAGRRATARRAIRVRR